MRTTLTLACFLFCAQGNSMDLPVNPVKAYDCDRCSSLSHEILKAHWKIDPIPFAKGKSNLQKSYSYNLQVTASQLQQGVNLPTHAPGAIVRITPLTQNALIPALELKSASSQFMSLKEASSLYAQDEEVDESLINGQHQTMLQLKPELSSGNFVIKSKSIDSAKKDQKYLINVFEKYALIYLQIKPSALQYQYGEQFDAFINLKDNSTSYPIDDIQATLVSPDNQTLPLQLKELKRNQFKASTLLSSDKPINGANWYIDVSVMTEDEENNPILRSGRAAFSYSIPSATLVNIKKISSKPLTLKATVEVATASRYALQSVLYKKNPKGELLPLETAQSAQWLEPGKQTITLSFDNLSQLAEDQLSIGYLHLTDYGQLKTVYQYDQPIQLSQLNQRLE